MTKAAICAAGRVEKTILEVIAGTDGITAGAVRAAQWIMDKEKGLYSIQGVLGLNTVQ